MGLGLFPWKRGFLAHAVGFTVVAAGTFVALESLFPLPAIPDSPPGSRGATLAGEIRLAGGRRIQGPISFFGRYGSGAGIREVRLASDQGPGGEFVLRGVPPGRISIEVRGPDLPRLRTRPFHVTEGDRIAGIIIQPDDVLTLTAPAGGGVITNGVALYVEEIF